MSKFKVGDRVIVEGNEPPFSPTKEMRNGVGVVSGSLDRKGYYGVTLETGYYVAAKPENIHYHAEVTVYTTPPSQITLNGATYVLKEEPKPDHEWKFGDWARHPKYGVVFVVNISQEFPKEIWVNPKEQITGCGCLTAERVRTSELTYISSATIPE